MARSCLQTTTSGKTVPGKESGSEGRRTGSRRLCPRRPRERAVLRRQPGAARHAAGVVTDRQPWQATLPAPARQPRPELLSAPGSCLSQSFRHWQAASGLRRAGLVVLSPLDPFAFQGLRCLVRQPAHECPFPGTCHWLGPHPPGSRDFRLCLHDARRGNEAGPRPADHPHGGEGLFVFDPGSSRTRRRFTMWRTRSGWSSSPSGTAM